MGKDEVEPYRLRSDPSVRPRHAVIRAVREAPDVDLIDSKTPLYEYINLEALEALLLHSRDTDISITVSVSDVTLTVERDSENRVIVVEVSSRTV